MMLRSFSISPTIFSIQSGAAISSASVRAIYSPPPPPPPRGNGNIGTTGGGIGPAYEGKGGRGGSRAADLLHPEKLRAKRDAVRAY
ncbi:adenylosuccinate synthetase, partial [Neisseria meningitidis]|nr:adenylosuccinate synthetase [Neisseria meningitidis]